MDINSTSDIFHIKGCIHGVYGGMVLSYVVMSLCFILGTPAHSWLLWLSLHAGLKVNPTQVLPLNMTILDFFFSIQCAVYMSNVLIDNNTLWIVVFSISGLSWIGRPLMQVCISVEQYLAVIHPVMFLRYKDVKYRIAAAAVVWLITAAYAVYQNTYAHKFPNLMFNIFFFISVIIILFCCLSVLRALKHPGPGDTQIPTKRGRKIGNQQKRNAFNTIFSGLLIILFTYLPQISLSLFYPKFDSVLFYCNILSTMQTLNIFSVIITMLLKMHKTSKGRKQQLISGS